MTQPVPPGRRRAAPLPRAATAAPTRRSLRAADALPAAHYARRFTAATPQPRRGTRRVRSVVLGAGVATVAAGVLMGALTPPAAIEPTGDISAQGNTPAPAITADSAASLDFGREAFGASSVVDAATSRAAVLSSGVSRTEDGMISPLETLNIASVFGYRANPMGGYGAAELHTGIDYAAACGTPVNAAQGGTVEAAGWHQYGGGLHVVIDHGDGTKTTYNHMSSLSVSAGQEVSVGEILGEVGTTGNSTGCHLHFEVLLNGVKVDPQPYL